MMLFTSGSNPDNMPEFKICGQSIEYKQTIKFLGVFLTSKLTWNVHLEHLLTKARKGINLLKLISKQSWGMNVQKH